MILIAHQQGHKVSIIAAGAPTPVMSAHGRVHFYRGRFPAETQKAH